MKILNFNKTFYKFLFAFMSIIFLSLVSYVYFYLSAKTLMRNNIIDSGLNSISNIGSDMDRNIYDVYKLIYNIRTDPSVEQYNKAGQQPFYEYYLLQRAIIKNMTSSQLAEDVLLYLRNDDIIISKEGSFAFDTYFDKYLANSSKNKYFWRDYLEKSNRMEVFPEEVYSTTDFVDSVDRKELLIFSAGRLNYANISMVVLVSKDKLAKVSGGDVIIIDPDGSKVVNMSGKPVDTSLIVQHLTPEKTTGYETMVSGKSKQYVFYNKSPNYMWYYVKQVPYSSIYEGLNYFNRIAVIVIAFLLLTTVLLSYVYSVSLYRPIKRLVDLVKNDSGVNYRAQPFKSEIQRVLYYIQSICSNYETVDRKNKMLQEFNKEYFYERMIKNSDISRYESVLRELNIDPANFGHIRVINFRICLKSDAASMLDSSDDAAGKLILAIKEIISVTIESMDYDYYCFNTEDNLNTVILPLKNKSFDQGLFFEKINDILKNDREYFYIVMSISREYMGIEKLSAAFSDALDIFQYQTLKEENQFLTEGDRKPVNFYKPVKEMTDRLDALIDTGRFEGLYEVLSELLEQYCGSGVSLFHIRNDLNAVLKAIAGKVCTNPLSAEQMDTVVKKIGRSSSKKDFDGIFRDIAGLANTRCDGDKRTNSSQAIIESMMKYIETNYHEDISLDFFSSRYKMNSIYLSKVFKDVTGTNYSDFVNRIRMEQSKRMLLESDMKIKDISLKVGYMDPNTFNKVFKKHYGVSPGEFRRYAASRQ